MIFEELKSRAISEWQELQVSNNPRILVGAATCGRASGAFNIIEAIRVTLARFNVKAEISEVGCIGTCYAEPLIAIIKPGLPQIYYGFLTPDLASLIIEEYLVNGNPRPDLSMGTIGERRI